MKRLILLIFSLGSGFALAQQPDSTLPPQTASIFVQDPEVFHQRELELQALQGSLENRNEALDSLLNDANRMVKMNDQCATVSINEVMGDECWDFYRVELPAFEERYMRVTGEVRLGYMETTRGLEDRKKQIDACVEALQSFASSKDQYLNMDGGVFLEPLSKGFQANYNFALRYEPKHQSNSFAIAKKWGETCREMVVRQDGEGFAPFFLERLEILNTTLSKNGSRAMFKTDSSSHPLLYLDNSQPIRSAYYLNGVKLFHGRISSGSFGDSHLRIHFQNSAVDVDGESSVVKNGEPMLFKGSVTFNEKSASMNGRWIWENGGNTEGVDFGPDYDEVAVDTAAAETASVGDSQANEPSADEPKKDEGPLHFSPYAAATFGFVNFSNKSALEYGFDKNSWMMMPDFAIAVRAGIGGDVRIYAGAGAMVGMAYGDDLERVWLAPLAQIELRYLKLGFRETAIVPIPDDYDYWLTFRTGIFYSFGKIGIELGHEFVCNVGQGAFGSVYFAW